MKAYKSILSLLSLLSVMPMFCIMYYMVIFGGEGINTTKVLASVILFVGGILIMICLQEASDR